MPAGEIDTILDTDLTNQGGFTPVHNLVPFSPATSAGDATLLPEDVLDLNRNENVIEPMPYDQRGEGYPRISGQLDIGAVEYAGTDQLTIQSFDLTPDYAPLGQVQVVATIENISEEDFGSLRASLYHSADEFCDVGTDTFVEVSTLERLAASTSVELTFDIQFDRAALFERATQNLQTHVEYLCVILTNSDGTIAYVGENDTQTAYDDFTYFPWDIPQDGILDGITTPTDVVFVLNRQGEDVGTSDIHPYADVNGDGVIDQVDADAMIEMIGQTRDVSVEESD